MSLELNGSVMGCLVRGACLKVLQQLGGLRLLGLLGWEPAPESALGGGEPKAAPQSETTLQQQAELLEAVPASATNGLPELVYESLGLSNWTTDLSELVRG